MKTTILTLLALAAIPALSFADGQVPMFISNGHGQTTIAYRQPAATSVALFVSGRGVGAAIGPVAALQTESKTNGHGQSTVAYRAVR
jgi:hypothetical protein